MPSIGGGICLVSNALFAMAVRVGWSILERHGTGRVLFGSDYPYLRRDLAVSCRREVESSAELQVDEARAILVRNALKLFPRFAGHAATQTTNTA